MKREIFNDYLDRVMNLFDLSEQEIAKKTKARYISDARQVLWYLCRKRNLTLREIVRYMDELNFKTTHTSVIHGVNAIENRMLADKDYKDLVKSISDE